MPQVAREKQVRTVVSAAELYETATVNGLWMGGGDSGIRLFQGEVVENDGPGAGRSDAGWDPFLEVSGKTALRKALRLGSPGTGKAKLAFIARERRGHDATLRFTVNGREVLRAPSPVAAPEARQYWELARDEGAWSWSRWYYVDLPAGVLVPGENLVTVEAVDGRLGWSLMVADYRDFEKGMPDPVVIPKGSSIRRHEADVWTAERGEYVVRFVLECYRSSGELVSPVYDAAGEEASPVKGRRRVASVSLVWGADCPEGTEIRFEVRTGSRPAYGEETWSAWKPCMPGVPLEAVRGRYIQWRALFSTSAPDRTPVLREVAVEAEVEAQGSPPLRVVRAQNARILRSSFDFGYEAFDGDMLRELRERFELDAVVAGAQTEFERIEHLMEWAYRVPLGECTHFPWNVLDWLVLERDAAGAIRMNAYSQRRRDKMCLYPNVVLVAACLSMGIPARHVNFHSEGMTGHEIAEAWSNDYGKWVHLDATRDYYWYDPKTRVPLDTLEIHHVLSERLDEVERWDRPYLFRQDLETLVKDLPIAFREGAYPFSVAEGGLFLFRSFCHFRTIPRFDVFSRPRPLPVSQGTEVWAWSGYLNWADDRVPPLLHFGKHTNRRADFYPTLNQTRFTAERTEDPRVLEVHLETQTPGFDGYRAKVDRGAWRAQEAVFPWLLHEGMNTLEVRSCNRAGVEGGISSLAAEVR